MKSMKFTLAAAMMMSFVRPLPLLPIDTSPAADMRRQKRKGGPAHSVSSGVRAAKRAAVKRKNVERNKAHH